MIYHQNDESMNYASATAGFPDLNVARLEQHAIGSSASLLSTMCPHQLQ
jgi:hypothetical protein